jgi:predicted nucleotide-binding protein
MAKTFSHGKLHSYPLSFCDWILRNSAQDGLMSITLAAFDDQVSKLRDLSDSGGAEMVRQFVSWLESDPALLPIIDELRGLELSVLMVDFDGDDLHYKPACGTPQQNAAIALRIVDRCWEQKWTFSQLSRMWYLTFSPLRAHSEVMNKFIFPLAKYVRTNFKRATKISTGANEDRTNSVNPKDVFVVHGRDDAAKHEVARFIERLGLRAIILHEQSNRGRTIIEKFEKHAEVQFAVILLTPDEIGRLNSEPNQPFEQQARQNVIFEMGYFIGRITRLRVFPLTKGDVKVPSDYSGVVYTDMDSAGAWKIPLIKELKDAGFEVDSDKAFD